MSPEPIICQGQVNNANTMLAFNGSYPTGDQVWSWRTEFELNTGRPLMRAYNISPDQQEDMALSTTYFSLHE